MSEPELSSLSFLPGTLRRMRKPAMNVTMRTFPFQTGTSGLSTGSGNGVRTLKPTRQRHWWKTRHVWHIRHYCWGWCRWGRSRQLKAPSGSGPFIIGRACWGPRGGSRGLDRGLSLCGSRTCSPRHGSSRGLSLDPVLPRRSTGHSDKGGRSFFNGLPVLHKGSVPRVCHRGPFFV